MIEMSIRKIADYMSGNLVSNNEKAGLVDVVIDSRLANKDTLFISIIGENTDGHKYLKSAYDNGCRCFVVQKNNGNYNDFKRSLRDEINDISFIEVDDTEIALGNLAREYRKLFDIKVIGVTGSVGKTSTRDFIFSVLNHKFNTLKNEKNYNNQFGVPLTILKLDDSYEVAVIEMGMTGLGEIEYLKDIVNPEIGVITLIGTSHIEKLGSRENILRAKMEIAKGFDQNNTLILNGDDEYLETVRYISPAYKVKYFGSGLANDVSLIKVNDSVERTSFTIKYDGEKYKFEIPVAGYHNVFNAMSAILCGLEFNMTMDEIREGLLNFKPTDMRQEIIKTKKYVVINDAYNASLDSMIAALNVLSIAKGRKVAILGDMFELGDFAEQSHRNVGKKVAFSSDKLITVGQFSKYIGEEAMTNGLFFDDCIHFDKKEDLIKNIEKYIEHGDTILVKASRGMELEEVVNRLVEIGGGQND